MKQLKPMDNKLFNLSAISKNDLESLYAHLFSGTDFNKEFEADSNLKSMYDKLIELAWYVTKGYIVLDTDELGDKKLVNYRITADIPFDESDFEDMNEAGGISIVTTIKEYSLLDIRGVLDKY
jgi:hypothetical protein